MNKTDASTVEQGSHSRIIARNSEQPIRFSGDGSEAGPASVPSGLAALLVRRNSLFGSRTVLEAADTSLKLRLASNHEKTAVTNVDSVSVFPRRNSLLQSQTAPPRSIDGHVPIHSSPAREVSTGTKENALVCSQHPPPEDELRGMGGDITSVASNGGDCHVQEPEQVVSEVQAKEHSRGGPKEAPAPEMRTTSPTVMTTIAGCSCTDVTFPSLKEKRLEDWPLIPLRKECLNLGISGMSKEKDKIKMAELIRRARQLAASRKERISSADMSATFQGEESLGDCALSYSIQGVIKDAGVVKLRAA